MNHPTDNIRCGSTLIRYYDGYGAWMLPDKSFTNNPLKAHRIAAETEAAKSRDRSPWELYEIDFLINRPPNITAISIAKKLDRTVSEVQLMLKALSGSK